MSEKLQKNLKNYVESNGVLISIKALANEYFKEISDLNKDELKDEILTRMQILLQHFNSHNLTNTKNLRSAMEGINQALVGAKEKELYKLLDEQDSIARKIRIKQDEIRNTLVISYESAERLMQESNAECKDEVLGLIGSAIIRETRMLGILKESSQNAFLTTIENGINIHETISQISKNMAYSSILQGEFSRDRIIEISRTIILAAAEVANEGHIFANVLVDGAVVGVKDGISLAVAKIKDDAKFAPNEVVDDARLKELKNIDESFINMLKELETKLEAPAKDEIKILLTTTLDSLMAKLKRISEQANEQLSERINTIKENPNIAELINGANDRLEKLKSALNEREWLKGEIGDKFETIKKELDELEKKASVKFSEVKTINIKEEAKKMGDRAYKSAKEFIAKLKKDEPKQDNK
ncbi:hypothetical protein LMG7974_01154 [Campylobacter majalis]|uniref:Cell surface protein n=1 Tax=Campylobacter majalis TaxID=2790656 RepID=A0ABN7KBZ3_9BACT|nr:hypothetical protein [Campylobacter majalis]CAD7288790.1 hypothetical protein LMG7974_01154 [Campylobacter majalis]